MDVVITYVNMSDPTWVAQYKDTFDDEPNTSRFRELGTLNLQVQCIRKYMPWVNNIFLVVSTESQVQPIEGVTIITHNQIIPEEYLPTFNSCTIELFLYRIPNLSEYFIYFNDDIFPVDYLRESEFFETQPILYFKHVNEPPFNIFRCQCKNSSNLARLITGLDPSSKYVKPDHICLIHSKSVYEYVWSKLSKTLRNSITKRRSDKNINQYIFVDYMYYKRMCKLQRLNYVFFQYSLHDPQELKEIIVSRKVSLICIQDDSSEPIYHNVLLSSLQENLRNG